MDTTEGGIEQVHVRAKWKHEAHGFTRWLARNLDLLGEAIGIPLELKQREAPVGPLFLDILASDTDSGALVAIENQLAPANLQHLGQLLAYATGFDAGAAVWVAPEFSHHHGTALHRLNEWTSDGIRFYAVKVEVVRRDGSAELEPRFRKVVWPGGWDEDALVQPEEESPAKRRYREFFQPLIDEQVRSGFADRARQDYDHTERIFPSRLYRGIGYVAAFGKRAAFVGLRIRMGKKARTKHTFDELHADRAGIEAELADVPDVRWVWHRHDSFTYSSINLVRDGEVHDSPDRPETREWMLDALPRLRDVFDPRLAAILESLPTTDGA